MTSSNLDTMQVSSLQRDKTSNIVFNLTYLGVTVLANATTAPPKTQVKTALD